MCFSVCPIRKKVKLLPDLIGITTDVFLRLQVIPRAIKDDIVPSHKKDIIGWFRRSYIGPRTSPVLQPNYDLAYAMYLVMCFFDFSEGIDVGDWFVTCIESIIPDDSAKQQLHMLLYFLLGDVLHSRMLVDHDHLRTMLNTSMAAKNYLSADGKRQEFGSAKFYKLCDIAAKCSIFTIVSMKCSSFVESKKKNTSNSSLPKGVDLPEDVDTVCIMEMSEFGAESPLKTAVRFGLDATGYLMSTMFATKRVQKLCSFNPVVSPATKDSWDINVLRYEDSRERPEFELDPSILRPFVRTMRVVLDHTMSGDPRLPSFISTVQALENHLLQTHLSLPFRFNNDDVISARQLIAQEEEEYGHYSSAAGKSKNNAIEINEAVLSTPPAKSKTVAVKTEAQASPRGKGTRGAKRAADSMKEEEGAKSKSNQRPSRRQTNPPNRSKSSPSGKASPTGILKKGRKVAFTSETRKAFLEVVKEIDKLKAELTEVSEFIGDCGDVPSLAGMVKLKTAEADSIGKKLNGLFKAQRHLFQELKAKGESVAVPNIKTGTGKLKTEEVDEEEGDHDLDSDEYDDEITRSGTNTTNSTEEEEEVGDGDDPWEPIENTDQSPYEVITYADGSKQVRKRRKTKK